MARPRVPVHKALRDARRRKGWTQQRLADEIGASQPAISLYEANGAALSREKIAALAKALEVDLASLAHERPPAARASPPSLLWYCPNPACPSNVPCDIDGQVRYVPAMVRATAHRLRCADCGEVLLSRCQACGTLVEPGAFCVSLACGEPLVRVPGELRGIDSPRAWADRERARLREIRLLTQVRDRAVVDGHPQDDAGPAEEADQEDR